jgi:hypothetical protein
MAAFTALAAAAAGALLYKKIAGKKKQEATALAPAPTDVGNTGLQPPAPPTPAPGANQFEAVKAGDKQRKRAMQGSLLTNPKAPVSGATATPRLQAKSLIGY